MFAAKLRLEAACSTEENALSARKHDLFAILKDKNEPVFLEYRALHVGEVHDTAPVGAKKEGAVEPPLTAAQRASNEDVAVGEMDEREISTRLEEVNILGPNNPQFDIVSQKDKVITMNRREFVLLALRPRNRELLRVFFNCH
jgi:hypothetical protein